ncbi:uncharacterized protein B0H64DRAFT_381537 [Chaetomium fimeti]|uniref:F-box domain-containing protein n=1 Tax=Chaetomium fimeti TaxID=1854472 RepID=A0AAE0HRW0_9PEZI|nr:hypothetical protein B0H64DRAFT_381537 [Chaetomium fimeti]
MALHEAPRYHSAAKYRFSNEQADNIVRIAAYHRRDFALSVIWFPPREQLLVRASISMSFDRASNRDLGVLDLLPVELLHNIALRLDILSVFRLRQTNHRAREIMGGLKEYRTVALQGLDCFRALLRTGLAIAVSLSDFYKAVCTESCAVCGAFSGFISLVTWTRCCFECVQKAPETQLRSLASIQNRFPFAEVEIDSLQSFETLPGTYTMEEAAYKSRTAVVSLYQITLLPQQKGALAWEGAHPRPSARELRCRLKYNFMGACALDYYNKQTGKVERGVSCAGCQLAFEKGIIGSLGESWARQACDKVYSKAGYLEHFKWCEQAQLLWALSEGGSHQPAELPEAARRGGFFKPRDGE